jgi:hypothetical protein
MTHQHCQAHGHGIYLEECTSMMFAYTDLDDKDMVNRRAIESNHAPVAMHNEPNLVL